MGKARGLRIDAKFPDEGPKPKADSHDITFEYVRAQKIILRNKKYKTRLLRHLRRLQRDIVAAQRRKIRLVLFGFWKYWYEKGLIGPEDDSEPNLVHN